MSKPSEVLKEEVSLTIKEKETVAEELWKSENSNKKRQKYCKWTHVQRVEIGKHVPWHENAVTVRLLGGKYPGLKRQIVSDFKLAYLELKKKEDKADDDAKDIVKKKTGRPTLLPSELMQEVVDLVSALRLKRALVSSSVVCSVARGVILANERPLLLKNGGHIDLNIDWSRQVPYRFGTV